MKKAIALFTVILAVIIAAAVFAACGETGAENNGGKEPSAPSDNIGTTEDNDGKEPVAPHDHTGTGKCAVCGLDFYDAFADIIKEHGEATDEDYDETTTERCYWLDYVVEDEVSENMVDYDIVYLPQSDVIKIRRNITSVSGDPFSGITVLKVSTEIECSDAYGKYQWKFAQNSATISGELDAATGTLRYSGSGSSFGSNTQDAIDAAVVNVIYMLNAVDSALAEYDAGFTMKNFGFTVDYTF